MPDRNSPDGNKYRNLCQIKGFASIRITAFSDLSGLNEAGRPGGFKQVESARLVGCER